MSSSQRSSLESEGIESSATEPLYPEELATTYDDIISQCGIGRFHYTLLAICMLANAADAVEVLAVSFSTGGVFQQFEVSSALQGVVTGIVFLGLMCGGVLWGNLADTWGRRKVLITALLLNSTCGMLSAASFDVYSFILLRFFTGIGIGGALPVVFTYFSEFFPERRKGQYIVYLSLSWMIGSIFCAGAAWIIIGTEEHNESSHTAWRIFLLVSALPAFASACLISFLPASPQFLLGMQLHQEAAVVIGDIQATNGVPLTPSAMIEDVEVTPPPLAPQFFSSKWFIRLFDVFRGAYRLSAIVCTLIWLSLSFSFYGFTMWQPQYLKSQGLDAAGGLSVYEGTFFSNLAQLPGTILSAFAVNAFGRKQTLVLSLAAAAVVIFCLPIANSSTSVVVLSCVFSGTSIIAWNMLNVVTSEQFDWAIRGTAYGLFASIGRVGAFLGTCIFGAMSGSSTTAALLCVSIGLVIAACSTFFLPPLSSLPHIKGRTTSILLH